MRIFLTGAGGQLGKACQAEFSDHELFLADIDTCDITDPEACRSSLQSFAPEVIIHTAGYTNVKQAEIDADICYRVNLDGTYYLARYARENSCRMVYISTDFVFGGDKKTPYHEEDPVHPLNVYARSKFAGELVVQDLVGQHFILRTAWLYGEGKNFARTILALAEKHQELPVVADQYGTPTSAADLAHFINVVLEKAEPGVYHASNDGVATWAEFAQEVLRLNALSRRIIPLTSREAAEQFSDTTRRPMYSVMSKDKLKRLTTVRPWQEALADYFTESTTLNK